MHSNPESPGEGQRTRVFVLAFALAVSAFLASIAVWGWVGTFGLFRVGAMQPVFADLRTITGALDSRAHAFDPHVTNPGDPWGRRLNYPEIWVYLLRGASLFGDPVLIVGAAQAALLIGLGLFLSRRSHGYLATLFMLSPPVLLLLERGSSDTLVFVLTLIGFRYASIGGGMALGLAAALKLFPAAGIAAALFSRPRRGFAIGVALVSPLIVWSAWQAPSLLGATPDGASSAFGARSLAILVLFHVARRWPQAAVNLAAIPSVTMIVDVGFAGAAVLLWLALRPHYAALQRAITSRDPVFQRMLIGFLFLFVTIFCSGSHFAYRLIFLLPVLWGFADLERRALLVGGLAILYVPLLHHGWIILNPAVAIYTVAIAPLLIETVAARLQAERSDSGYGMRDSGCGMRDAGSGIRD